jgi:hypothetical protein
LVGFADDARQCLGEKGGLEIPTRSMKQLISRRLQTAIMWHLRVV